MWRLQIGRIFSRRSLGVVDNVFNFDFKKRYNVSWRNFSHADCRNKNRKERIAVSHQNHTNIQKTMAVLAPSRGGSDLGDPGQVHVCSTVESPNKNHHFEGRIFGPKIGPKRALS